MSIRQLFPFLVRRTLATKYPAHTMLRMPALSPTMTKGNIGPWKKKEGDAVAVGDVLVEIETDKAQMEFECPEDGYLARVILKEGEKDVPISKPLAIIVDDKKKVAEFRDFAAEPDGASAATSETDGAGADDKKKTGREHSSAQQPALGGGRVAASPLAKSVAKQSGIDLRNVAGSGPQGRIVKSDVLSGRQGSAKAAQDPRMKYTDIPLSGMRKTIADRLSASAQTIPHYYLTLTDLSMTMVLRARSQLNADASSIGLKLSVNDFVLKAAAMALRAVPQVNSQWLADAVRQFETVDVSFAVATEAGLLTPIVRDADKCGLLLLSQTARELADRAKAGKLRPEEFQGGTFTVSNLGMLGVSHFTAIINPPQAAILAVGKVDERELMSVTLSCDHRIIDGATGAKWLAAFRGFLEEPFKLLL